MPDANKLFLSPEDYERYSGRSFEQDFVSRMQRPASPQHDHAPRKHKIPDSLRWAVWKRDNFTCQRCGQREYLTVDHIVPESQGGPTALENCQTLCRTCNSRKGTSV